MPVLPPSSLPTPSIPLSPHQKTVLAPLELELQLLSGFLELSISPSEEQPVTLTAEANNLIIKLA